jgi:hypothetical protein
LLNKEKTNLPHAILDLIDKICHENKLGNNEYSYEKPNSNKLDLNLLEKLYLLSEYRHDQCGYIFRNSMKYSHLRYDVLKIKKDHTRQKRSINEENNLIKKHFRYPNKNFALNSPDVNEKYVTRIEKRYSAKKYTTSINLKPNYSAATYKMKHKIINLTKSMSSQLNEFNSTKGNFIATNLPDLTYSSSQPIETYTNKSQNLPSIKYTLSNCSLLLLNVYLLAYKSNCDYSDFTETLASFDCVSYKFSVVSNCTQCKVSIYHF